MSMRAVRGFDHENSYVDIATNGVTLQGPYPSYLTFVAGRTSGGKAVQFGAGYRDCCLQVPLNAAVASGTEVFVGGAGSNVITGNSPICLGVASPEGFLHAYVQFTGSNIIAYRAGASETYPFSASPTVLGSTLYAFPSGWTRIEVGIKVHATAGEVHVRVAGGASDVLTLTGLNTLGDTNSSMSSVGFCMAGSPHAQNGNNSNNGPIFDDLYCCDGTGTINNNFLGEGIVNTSVATADSAVQFTHLSGSSNFAMVDETTMDSDTTYNVGASAGLSDLFTHGTVASTFSIHAVQITNASRKDAAGTCSLANIISSSGTDDTGATNPLTSTYAYYSDIVELDPATGAAWTVTGFNASLIGYGRVA